MNYLDESSRTMKDTSDKKRRLRGSIYSAFMRNIDKASSNQAIYLDGNINELCYDLEQRSNKNFYISFNGVHTIEHVEQDGEKYNMLKLLCKILGIKMLSNVSKDKTKMYYIYLDKNDNETLTVSQSMVKAINHAYISMVQDTFKNIVIWKDGEVVSVINNDEVDKRGIKNSMLNLIKNKVKGND